MKGFKLSLCVGVMMLGWTGLLMAQEQTEKLGNVHFPTSCSVPAQQQFDRALAALHSFWYEEALRVFTLVTEIDHTGPDSACPRTAGRNASRTGPS